MPGRCASASALVLSILVSFGAAAQELSVNALADMRLVRPSSETSWTIGGLGRFRYDGSGDQSIDARFGQALADVTLKFGSDALIFATVRAEPTQQTAADVLEAYGLYHFTPTDTTRLSVKLGAFYPPVSLENDGIGWTSPWTLTPSAINSWVGDELRTLGGEANVEWKTAGGAFGLTGALFGGNDPTGVLIAARGWSFNDRPTGLFDHVRIADEVARRSRRTVPYYESEFLEMDDRVGYYAGFSWRDNRLGRLALLHYDNRADPAARRFGQIAWRTEFNSIGIEAYLKDYILISQAMAGETEIDPAPAPRSVTRFKSAYVLAGRRFGDWSAAVRLDVFATQVPVGTNQEPSERGHALTVAATWSPARWFQLTGELLRSDSRRAQRNAVYLSPHAVETQFQLNARFLY